MIRGLLLRVALFTPLFVQRGILEVPRCSKARM
jgi:hypothetical protein